MPPSTPSLTPEQQALSDDRSKVYGDPRESHRAIGKAWEAILANRYHGLRLEIPEDLTALMLAAFKTVRASRPAFHKDSFDDNHVYVGFAEQFAAALKAEGREGVGACYIVPQDTPCDAVRTMDPAAYRGGIQEYCQNPNPHNYDNHWWGARPVTPKQHTEAGFWKEMLRNSPSKAIRASVAAADTAAPAPAPEFHCYRQRKHFDRFCHNTSQHTDHLDCLWNSRRPAWMTEGEARLYNPHTEPSPSAGIRPQVAEEAPAPAPRPAPRPAPHTSEASSCVAFPHFHPVSSPKWLIEVATIPEAIRTEHLACLGCRFVGDTRAAAKDDVPRQPLTDHTTLMVQIENEIANSFRKHGFFPTDLERGLRVIGGEYGEASEAMNDFTRAREYHKTHKSIDLRDVDLKASALRQEVVQVVASGIQFIIELDHQIANKE